MSNYQISVKTRSGITRKDIKRETNVELLEKIEPGLYIAKGAILNALSRAGHGRIETPNVIIELETP
jgi:hypothetical protein